MDFFSSPWLSIENTNLMMGRSGQVKMEYLEQSNLSMDYKTKQQEKKHLMRKMLLNMKKPPKKNIRQFNLFLWIRLKDDRCIVKTQIYQINYDLTYDNETESFYWKIPRTRDIQISDNGLSYLQNFLKDEKSKKDIQNALDDLTKSLQRQKKQLIALKKERNKRFQSMKVKQDESESGVKLEYSFQVKQEIELAKDDNKSSNNLGLITSMEFSGEGISLQEEYNYQILQKKSEIMNSYVFCYIDQKIKSIFSDQVLEILQKHKNKEYLQKKFGPEVVYLQKNSDIKDKLRFNNVLIRFQPQTAMLQSVLRQENLLKNKGENKITQTSIYIEHISFDTETYFQYILSQEKINFYRQIRSKPQSEQMEIIEKIQNYKPNPDFKEQINFKYIIVQEAIKNDLLPKQSFQLTPFDTIYIKTNITLSQIDSTLLRPFLNLEEENQHSVDSLFLINKPKEGHQESEKIVNTSNSDNGSYLSVVIGDKIDLEIILQQYRVIMLQQFFISNYKLSQQDESQMHLEGAYEQKSSNITLLIRQKREIYEEDRDQIKANKIQNGYLTQAVVKLSSHPMIKGIVYQVLICIKAACQGLEQKDEPEVYYIIIPYLTDKQHYLIYCSLNQDIIELNSSQELKLDELIQDLQRKEQVIQNFVNTVYIAQIVQKNVLHSQFKAISEESCQYYKQITIECRLKDELNSDKPIKIIIFNNFNIIFEYFFGDLSDQKQIESIPRNCGFFQFYQQFFSALNNNIYQGLKHIYQRYHYLSDDRTRIIKEVLKSKILNDGWFTVHSLKTRPETIIQPPQVNNQGSNQNFTHHNLINNPHTPNGQQNGPTNPNPQQQMRQNPIQNQQGNSQNPQQQQQNPQGHQQMNQGQQGAQQQQNYNNSLQANNQNPNQQRQQYGQNSTAQQQLQGGVQNQQGNNSNYGQQGGQANQRNPNPQQYQQNQPPSGNNYHQGQQQQLPHQGNPQNQQQGGNNYPHANGAQNPSYNQQQYQGHPQRPNP